MDMVLGGRLQVCSTAPLEETRIFCSEAPDCRARQSICHRKNGGVEKEPKCRRVTCFSWATKMNRMPPTPLPLSLRLVTHVARIKNALHSLHALPLVVPECPIHRAVHFPWRGLGLQKLFQLHTPSTSARFSHPYYGCVSI